MNEAEVTTTADTAAHVAHVANQRPSRVGELVVSPVTGAVTRIAWGPGQTGNANGRPNAGLTIIEHMNRMATWSAADVRKVMDDQHATLAERAAARCWLHAQSEQCSAAGSPIAGPELDRLLDRTAGKAQATINLNGGAGNSLPDALIRKMPTPRMRQLVEWLMAETDEHAGKP